MIARVLNIASLVVIAAALIFAVRVITAPSDVGITYDAAGRRVPAVFLQAASSGHRLGPEEAPTVLLLYSDYFCSFCSEFDLVLQRIRRRYPEHLAIIVKPFTPLGTGTDAKMFLAAECAADQGVFEAFHSMGLRLRGLGGRAAGWKAVADSVKVPDRGLLDQCVGTALHAQRIEVAYDEGRALGVTGTPTFFVNGVPYVGSYDFAELDSIVALALPRRRPFDR